MVLVLGFREMLEMGEDVATCPSCSLIVRVIYDPDLFVKMETLTVSSPTAVLTNTNWLFIVLLSVSHTDSIT